MKGNKSKLGRTWLITNKSYFSLLIDLPSHISLRYNRLWQEIPPATSSSIIPFLPHRTPKSDPNPGQLGEEFKEEALTHCQFGELWTGSPVSAKCKTGREGMGSRAHSLHQPVAQIFSCSSLRSSTSSLPGSAQSPRVSPSPGTWLRDSPTCGSTTYFITPTPVLSVNHTDKDSQGSGQGSAQLLENTEMPQDLFQAGILHCFPRWRRIALYKALSICVGFHRRTKANDATFPA